ncbi:hypothetical protein VPNG_03951 [Cytospora leucostoma]|uniref:Uncharacterized protein n=1 Tax=Cytospora leucostoma TaxID=1230097 RepID=A0A423XE74_9PEZI|nr:hypothetical protein VPNG_03951 [Cytospora leucostoma]
MYDTVRTEIVKVQVPRAVRLQAMRTLALGLSPITSEAISHSPRGFVIGCEVAGLRPRQAEE